MASTREILRRILRNTFWDSYDFLGTLIVASMLSFLLCVPVVTIPLALAGILEVSYRVAGAREARVRDFFHGIHRLGFTALALVAVNVLVLAFTLLNILFYLSLRGGWRFAWLALAALCFWAFLVFALGQLYVIPLASRPGVALRVVLKQGYLLMLARLGVTIEATFHLLLLTVLMIVTGVGVVVLQAGVTAVFVQHVAGETLAEVEGRGDTRKDERRSLRELLPPWDHDLRS